MCKIENTIFDKLQDVAWERFKELLAFADKSSPGTIEKNFAYAREVLQDEVAAAVRNRRNLVG